MKTILTGLMLMAATIAQAQPASPPAAGIAGVWSLGETRNCQSGPSWVFFADGFYAEITLPSTGPAAIGMWRESPTGIIYTHAHLPYEGHERPMQQRELTFVERSADRMVTRNYRGVPRIFHRCPASALAAPPGTPAH
jgi:hypothetical protein